MLLEGIINFSVVVVHICLRFIAEKFFTEIDLAQINHNKNYNTHNLNKRKKILLEIKLKFGFIICSTIIKT
jgi:hypothetical protein